MGQALGKMLPPCAALALPNAAASVPPVHSPPLARSTPPVLGGLWFVFFLLGMSPGYYAPALANILAARGLGGDWLALAFLAGPIASLVSPLIVGALADNRFAAQKVFGWIGLISSALLGGAFWVLDLGWSPWAFIGLLGASSIVAAPMWGMLTSISMAHLKSGEREFPLVRLGGTLGWMAAGALTSYVLHADQSVNAGYAGAVARFAGGIAAFFLPHTPPVGKSRSWRTLMGLDAFRLLRERDHLVFFSITALLSMPLAAFFMHTPMHLLALGNERVAATMTVGQISEIAAMLLMAAVLARFRVKTMLMVALVLSALRYAIFAVAGQIGSPGLLIGGIALHGLCYTFYFITGQLFLDRRVEPGMRTQAQGLLSLVSNGIGTLAGTIFARYLHEITVVAGHGGWPAYWWVQTACIIVCIPLLGVFYRGAVVR